MYQASRACQEVGGPDPGRYGSENEARHPTLEVLTFVDLPEGRSRIDGLSLFLQGCAIQPSVDDGL